MPALIHPGNVIALAHASNPRKWNETMSTGQTGLLPAATIDGLILLKQFALPSLYRQYDIDRVAIHEADITQLLARSARADRFFLEILADHVTGTGLTQLAAILADIRGRLARMSMDRSKSE